MGGVRVTLVFEGTDIGQVAHRDVAEEIAKAVDIIVGRQPRGGLYIPGGLEKRTQERVFLSDETWGPAVERSVRLDWSYDMKPEGADAADPVKGGDSVMDPPAPVGGGSGEVEGGDGSGTAGEEAPRVTVRAKFEVWSVDVVSEGDGARVVDVHMQPVYGGSPENDAFFDATPSGAITMRIKNPAAQVFEQGQQFYVDFTRA